MADKNKDKKKRKGLKGVITRLWSGDSDAEYVESAHGVQTTEIRSGAGS